MILTLVDSSSIYAVGYDGHTLDVEFHASDIIYSHHGGPYSIYVEFMNAPSMGKFYNRFLRGRYQ